MPDLPELHYRVAADSDASRIADLHAESWRSAYRGLLSDAFLDNEVVEDRTAVWKERFENRAGTLTIVAEQGSHLVGFAHSMIDEDDAWGTLLDNLHVRPDAKRLGIGRRLMAETAAHLETVARHPRLHLWVLEGNHPAQRFYTALGGVVAGGGVFEDRGDPIPAVRYVWDRLDTLARLAD